MWFLLVFVVLLRRRRGPSPSADERDAVAASPAAARWNRRPRQGHPRQPGRRILAAGAGRRAHPADLRLRQEAPPLHLRARLPPPLHRRRPRLMSPRRLPGRPPTTAGAWLELVAAAASSTTRLPDFVSAVVVE